MKPTQPLTSKRAPRAIAQQQHGVALVFVLLMLVVATGVAVISARMTLSGNKASVNDRDRQIALQAAELALNDAELDIMDATLTRYHSGGSLNGRACSIGVSTGGSKSVERLARAEGIPCGKKSDPVSSRGSVLGYCGKPDNATPAHQLANWELAENNADRDYVLFGEFTGRQDDLQLAQGIAPAKAPRYIIVNYNDGDETDELYRYKVYALGYGSNAQTQVMLEGEFSKPKAMREKICPDSPST